MFVHAHNIRQSRLGASQGIFQVTTRAVVNLESLSASILHDEKLTAENLSERSYIWHDLILEEPSESGMLSMPSMEDRRDCRDLSVRREAAFPFPGSNDGDLGYGSKNLINQIISSRTLYFPNLQRPPRYSSQCEVDGVYCRLSSRTPCLPSLQRPPRQSG